VTVGRSGRLQRAWTDVRRRATELRDEVQVVALAARDPRTGRLPKVVVSLVVAYVLSPIDPIPDVIPVLGLLDELVVVPLGLALAIRLMPPAALAEARDRHASGERVATRLGIAVVAALWLATAVGGWVAIGALR